ncbi:MAG: 3-hydroxyacyl-ACP dehydratase FabZ family protein [Xanthobacteraceae bacterium]
MRLEYFQMVDRIVALDAAARVVRSICNVPRESTVFEGHFPSYPLMPGVLLTECMAQTTGWLANALCGFTGMAILAGVKEAKFRTLVFPGDELEFEATVLHEGSGYTIGKCKGRRQGTVVCDAQLTFRIVPYPTPQLRQAMLEWAERLQLPVKELTR